MSSRLTEAISSELNVETTKKSSTTKIDKVKRRAVTLSLTEKDIEFIQDYSWTLSQKSGRKITCSSVVRELIKNKITEMEISGEELIPMPEFMKLK